MNAPVAAAADCLRETFERIHRERMADVPLCNPTLRVEVVGWREWNGEWLCALVTPWTLNLMLLPGPGGALRRLGADQRQSWHFPHGGYDFVGGDEPGLGPYQSCSLFSPVPEFRTQDEAVATAREALAMLLCPPPPVAGAQNDDAATPRAMTRRALLRGAI